MNKQISFLFFLCTLLHTSAFSQDVFTGKVTNAKNTPIANASILVLNANSNAITDSNGNFKLKLPAAGNYQLEINHIN